MKTLKVLSALLMLSFCNLLETKSSIVETNSEDEVTLVVSASGVSKDEAVKIALRSAIEQAYGTFISSNTTLLNDEIVKDEVVTISNGNIKDYQEIFCKIMPDKTIHITLRATVCVTKLINYAQSKGATAEFAGAIFASNLNMKELNKTSELKVLENLIYPLYSLFLNSFDYSLEVGTPCLDISGTHYNLPLYVSTQYNENLPQAMELFFSTLENISLTKNEIKEYKEHKYPYKEYTIGYTLNVKKNETIPIKHPKISIALRNALDMETFVDLLLAGVSDFEISDNLGGTLFVDDLRELEIDKKLISETNHHVSGTTLGGYRISEFYDLLWGVSKKMTFKFNKEIPISELDKLTNFEIKKRTTSRNFNIKEENKMKRISDKLKQELEISKKMSDDLDNIEWNF